jgi:hypothetical protein
MEQHGVAAHGATYSHTEVVPIFDFSKEKPDIRERRFGGEGSDNTRVIQEYENYK